ncbi:MAG: S8 family serine peptidase [Gaiellaceae bacterium]
MRRRTWVVGALATAAVVALVGTALAGAAATPQSDFTESPTAQSQSEYYVVTFKDPPAASYAGGVKGLKPTKPARGKKLNALAAEVRAYVDHLKGVHAEYRGWLNGKSPATEVVRETFLAANSIAIKANGAKPETLQQGPGVRYVAPSALYRPAMTVSSDLIDADEVWPSAGGRENAGAGIDVGVIDTGIRDDHEAFGCKADIPHKVYASGGNPPPAGAETIVFNHGTHVAGTVAGCVLEQGERTNGGPTTGTWSGVAPGANLYDYNVFPGFGGGFIAFGGSAFSHDICLAIEDGVADGMEVLNLSLGGAVQGQHDYLAECVNAANDAGVVVAVSAGNSGPGDSTIGSPGSAAGALTAGASTNPHFVGIPASGTVDGGAAFVHGAALGDFNNFDPAITADYTVTTPANGCTAITTDVTDKIALINRGACTFSTKVRNAEAAGAVGVLIVNNSAGDPTAMAHDGLAFPTIPAAMLGLAEGNAIKPSGTVTVDGTAPLEFITANEDIIAGFSSRGPTPFTALIKPDVTAPGVNVYSSVFDEQTGELGYAYFQGTSMAAPHLAGSAALLRQLHPDWSPEDVKSAMVQTAKRPVFSFLDGTSNAGTENLRTGAHDVVGREALARGGGRVDIDAADATPLTFAPASVSFGEWKGSKPVSASMAVAVRNVSGAPQTCTAATDGSPFVSVSPTAFALAPGGTRTLTVALEAGRSLAAGDHSGDVTVMCGSTTLKAPWWVRKS